ncbi:response regulator [Shinella sedimenti]|uniref:Response regulator n=1 Tax=Shinella sedimenti TaxID=2919913 RepID=A0ABT0CTJ5_9HYPH|nr:response regulator [Shinella sedimenti]MCJ8151943.1 response regulator [Shinella sedimenti]
MRVLIVEDEALLALELESEIEAAGHKVIGQAAAGKTAFELIEKERPEFAFVDVQLLDGPTGIDIGRHLAKTGIPFIFVSGNLKRIPDDLVGAIGALEKPYTMSGLQNTLAYVEAVISGDTPDLAPPSLVFPKHAKGECEASVGNHDQPQ